jgi:hypothetical protein
VTDAWFFFFLAFAAVWLVAQRRRALTGFEQLALLGTLAGGLLAIRSVVWFSLVAVVVLPTVIQVRSAPPIGSGRRPVLTWFAALCTAGLLIASSVVASRPSSWYESEYPAKAAAVAATVASDDLTLRVFASDRYADWLLWKEPQLSGRVAFDVRFELLTSEQLSRLVAFHGKVGSDWRSVTRGYRLILLDRGADQALEEPLADERGVRVLYRDDSVSLLLRPSA